MLNRLFHEMILMATQYDQTDHGSVFLFTGQHHRHPTKCGLRWVGINGNYVYQWAQDVYTAHGGPWSGLYEKERKFFMVMT
jgi:hypothetical protein